MHTCRNVADTCTGLCIVCLCLFFFFFLKSAAPAPPSPRAPLDGTAQLFVRRRREQPLQRAPVVVAHLCGSTAAFREAFECLISLLCRPFLFIFFIWLFFFVFHSQLCRQKNGTWSGSRSITDMASSKPGPRCPSVACLWTLWP